MKSTKFGTRAARRGVKKVRTPPDPDPAAVSAVRLEAIRWVEHVRSELNAIYVSALELKNEVRDNPTGLVALAFGGSLEDLYAILRGVENAESAASCTTLPPSRPVPDPIGVAARGGVK